MDSSNYLIGKTIRGYAITELLGKGGFAYVYRARPETGGHDVAMKVINKGLIKNEELKRRVEKEAEIHSSLNHESIIKLYEFFKEHNCVFLVLELCEKGTLTQYMDERGYPFSESEARDMLRQVVDGIIYLHSKNIMHRDLSPRNLLLTRNGKVKIADFGLAADTEDKHKTLCGTPNFMSPEVATRSLYGPEVDVWSLGCLLYHLLVGKPPFDATGVKRTLTNVVREECKIPPNLSVDAKELIELMLKKDAKRRIKLKDIKNHRFMNVSMYSNKSVSRGGSSVESGLGSSFASSSSGRRNHSNRITTDCILELDTIRSTGLSNYCSDVNVHPQCDTSSEHRRPQSCHRSPPVRHRSWENIQTSQNPIGLLKSKLPTLPSFGIQENGSRGRQRSPVPCSSQSRGRERDISEERKKQQMINAERNARYEEDLCDLLARNMDGKKTSSDCCLGGHGNSCSSCSHHQLCCSSSVQCSHMELCHCRRPTKHCSLEHLPHQEESGCCHHPQSSQEMKNSGQHSGHRSPSPKPKVAAKAKSLKNRMKCLNTSRLQPTRQKTRNAVVSILENGEVCVEFLKKSRQIEKVVEVCLISDDGWRVIIYKPTRHGVPLKDKPPPIPKDGADDIFSFESLPERHWKKYEYAARFVQLVRAKTTRLTYYSSKAKCVMMENIPDPDFEVSFYSGGKISKGSGNCSIETSYKLVDEDGVSTTVYCDADVQELTLHTQQMWEHFKEVESQCKLLEEAVMKVESSSGKSCFPVTIGRKPNNAVRGLSENNKENCNPSTVRSPLNTPFSHSIASFNGTFNTEQYLSDGSSPTSEMYSNRLISRQSKLLVTQHHQMTSLPVNQKSTSQNFPDPVFIFGVGFISQSVKGVHVQYIDHSEMFLPRDHDSEIVCTNASGEVTRYNQQSTCIPKEVQDKVSQIVSVMKQIFQTSYQNHT